LGTLQQIRRPRQRALVRPQGDQRASLSLIEVNEIGLAGRRWDWGRLPARRTSSTCQSPHPAGADCCFSWAAV